MLGKSYLCVVALVSRAKHCRDIVYTNCIEFNERSGLTWVVRYSFILNNISYSNFINKKYILLDYLHLFIYA